MNESTVGMHVRLALAVARACAGCGANVYAGVYHRCGEPDRKGGPDGERVEVEATAPIAGAAGGMLAGPPELVQTSNRTECEACGGKLEPSVAHVCDGNRQAP